jgi:DNA-binding PadR family transcriptional regulator
MKTVSSMVLLSVSLNGEKMEAKILKKIQERIIKSFMDTIIMSELRNGPVSGYDIISYIYNKFGLLVSSGTVYSLLYSLERNGLIEGNWIERKRVYKLTERGAKTTQVILDSTDRIKSFMKTVLKA